MPGVFRRWTAADEAAFVVALKLTREVKLAAAEIGRTPGGAYERRTRSSAFRRAWDQAVAEREPSAPTPPVEGPLTRVRVDGWTVARRRLFLHVIRRTGRTRDACAAAGLSTSAAYAFRRRCPEFARAWDEALAQGTPSAEEALFERAVTGWEEPIVQGGRVVATRRRFSDGLLRLALARQDEERAAQAKRRATQAKTDAVLVKRLAALEKRAFANERARLAAWVDKQGFSESERAAVAAWNEERVRLPDRDAPKGPYFRDPPPPLPPAPAPAPLVLPPPEPEPPAHGPRARPL